MADADACVCAHPKPAFSPMPSAHRWSVRQPSPPSGWGAPELKKRRSSCRMRRAGLPGQAWMAEPG